ncbi:carboxymuconolactone decarboxylase family protein [uncultured Sanguibacteroides sp.]|uniref:cupin domain-containing carboxymuconolactone decarboxylase family protein n=1 Tax=uncultured Sanguibacteroides sp. TaxID=1635151 RepID=UPI0025FF8978|nr:carboxymuconolactone decarboxylase family protein [uncultured Sanguibacteroides sp.]
MKQKIIIAIAALLLGAGNSLNAQNQKSMKGKEEPSNVSAFPAGKENTGYAQYFTGKSWLAPLTANKELNVPISNVTFEPGCRNNWHSHTGGQILIAVGGRGYYQEKGKPARELLPGDVVEIAPHVIHWHGAAPDSWFSHLAIECNPQTNKNTWLGPVDDEQYADATAKAIAICRLSDNAKRNLEAWQAGNELYMSDPELAEVFGNFAFDETQKYGNLDTRTRILVTMGSAIALQTEGAYRMLLDAALNNGISAVEIKEVIFQAIPYIGFAKAYDFIGITNKSLTAKGIKLPLEPQSTTSPETRQEKGLALQKSIFGDHIDKMYETSPRNQLHIQYALSGNCFGDYQTRKGLDVKTRELLTFSMLISQGGCEPQVKSHIQGNVNVGNGKETLLAVVTQLLPYIGYPRTLNAIACLNEVIPENK